jgi:hypothetical protein
MIPGASSRGTTIPDTTATANPVVAIYQAGDESSRLGRDSDQVEWLRTLELLDEWLPRYPTPGGGGLRLATQ